MKMLYVRHGESMGNVHGYDIYPDPTLSEIGVLQARAMAPVIEEFGPDAILASPVVRAMATACCQATIAFSGRRQLEFPI
jgi:broad specificity phosphatase PhoE